MSEALWALGRSTGVVALVLFSTGIVLGIVARSGRAALGLGRFGINELHRTAALTGTALIAVHVVSLTFDPYAQLRVTNWFVPFLASYKPFWQGLGTLAVDLLVIVTLVSLLRDRIGPKVFVTVHWLTYLLWPVSVAHAIGNGTNGTSTWLLGIVAVCALGIVSAVAWRLTPGYRERGFDRLPRRTSRQITDLEQVS